MWTLRPVILLLSLVALSAGDVAKPNVIVVLVDDLGWTDVACFGSRYHRTPHLDRLARDGMRFTSGYAACTVCSPTRAALLTGQYPARLHLTDWIAGHDRPFARLKIPDWTKQLELSTVTIAERLKTAGYATACIGKWHLGNETHFPEKHGFDRNIGGYHRGQPPSYHAPYGIPTLQPEGPAGEFLTDREAREAVTFITANKDRPFFLYLPHYAVHTPIQAKAEVVAKYQAIDSSGMTHTKPDYAALMESVDDAMGTIRAKLEELQIAGRTVIIFTGDNGGLIGPTSNKPLRVGKGSAYEGGVRVPWIVHWPGVTKAGSESITPVMTIDIHPTVLAMTGLGGNPAQPIDGVSLADHLRGGPAPDRDAIFWHYPHYHPGGATPYSAVRMGDWKLIHFYEDGRDELYDLANDLGETTDRAATEAARVKVMRTRLDQWLAAVGAQFPTPNPAHDPEKDRPRGKKK
jgi:arylsulfatase A